MSKLLFQDEVINGMDVYVEYTLDGDEVIFYDYGLELDDKYLAKRPALGGEEIRVVRRTEYVSLRGYENTRWIEERLLELIELEHTAEEDL